MNQDKFFFIVNPFSNSGQGKIVWESLLPTLKDAFPNCEWKYTTETEGRAQELVEKYLPDECKVVVAVGGDGTVHEIVNGLMLRKTAGKSTPYLAVLSTGTGCDFEKSFRISSSNPLENLLSLKTGLPTDLDVGQITSQNKTTFFVNIASCGISGEINLAMKEQMNKVNKKSGGKSAYLIASLKTLIKGPKYHLESYLNEEVTPRKQNIFNAFVCNGQTCGNGMKVGRFARLNDGLFTYVEIKSIPRFLAFILTPFLYSGQLDWFKKFIFIHHRIKKIKFKFDPQVVHFETDGEYLNTQGALEIIVIPNSLQLWVPQKI